MRKAKLRRQACVIQRLESRRLLAAVSWDGGGDGTNWNNALNWSGDVLPTASDDVTISVVTNPTIQIAAGTQSIRSLISDEAINVVGTLQVATTVDLHATMQLTGGTLQGGTYNVAAALPMIVSTTGTVIGVTVNGDITVPNTSGALRAMNGLTLNGTVNLTGLATQVRAINTQTFSGNGLIYFSPSGGNHGLTIEGTSMLTIAPTFTVRGAGVIGLNSEVSGNNTLINQGTIIGDSASTLRVGPIFINNIGTIQTLNGSVTIAPGSNYTLSGTIAVNGGALTISNNFSINPATVFSRNGGTVTIFGTINNTGKTLTLDNNTGTWILGGTINGGTINTVGANRLNSTTGTISGVTINGDVELTTAAPYLHVQNGMVLNGTIHMIGANSEVRAVNTETFSGNGTIAYDETTGVQRDLTIEGNSTLTLAPTFTVRGGRFAIGLQSFQTGNNSLINQGTIIADLPGQTLFMQPKSFTNNGVVRVAGGILNWSPPTAYTVGGNIEVSSGTMTLAGAFSVSPSRNFSRTGGAVNITGALNNASNTLTLDSSTGSWSLLGGSITGGTINLLNGQSLLITDTASTLSGVTLNGDLDLSAANAKLRLNNGLTLNGTMHLTSPTAEIRAINTQTFAGNGTISFEGSGTSVRALTIESTSTLTIAPSFTIRGRRGAIGLQSEAQGTNALVNSGTIIADVSGETLTVQPKGTFTNSGTVQAQNGATVMLASSNSGGILTGGIWRITSTGSLIIKPPAGADAALRDQVNALVKSGRNGGTWDGIGITSEPLPGNQSLGVKLDTSSAPASVVVRHTLVGDLNLDGMVSISDFIDLASNFQKTPAGWWDGDVNFDEQVSISDFIDLSSNFGNTIPPPPAQPAAAAEITAAQQALPSQPVEAIHRHVKHHRRQSFFSPKAARRLRAGDILSDRARTPPLGVLSCRFCNPPGLLRF